MQLLKNSSPAAHYNYLDGLRAVLALYVVGYHTWCTLDHYAHGSESRFLEFLAYGHYAVCFFIVISGFCLALPVLKTELRLPKGPRAFFLHRAWRILPPYYFALIFSLVLIHFFISKETGEQWDMSLPVQAPNVLTHFLLVQNFVPNDQFKINYVFWSIAVEWQIYFFFPLLLWIWRSMRGIFTTFAIISVSITVELGIHHYLNIQPRIWFLSLFALGVLAAQIGFTPGYKTAPWPLITGAIGILFLLSFIHYREIATDLTFGFLAASMLILVSFHQAEWLRSLLNFRPLVFIGTFSYSIYLVHAPLLQVLWQFGFSSLRASSNMKGLVLFTVGIPLIVAFSYFFHLCCEKPFLRRKTKVVAA